MRGERTGRRALTPAQGLESNEQLSYGFEMRAADPRYITNGDDSNRGDMLLTMAQVRELIAKKDQAGHCLANHS